MKPDAYWISKITAVLVGFRPFARGAVALVIYHRGPQATKAHDCFVAAEEWLAEFRKWKD